MGGAACSLDPYTGSALAFSVRPLQAMAFVSAFAAIIGSCGLSGVLAVMLWLGALACV